MKIHLSAICGTAMASLAGLLRERGHEVTGSDQNVYPPMSTQLEEMGISIRSPFDAKNVPLDAELVVIGNALSRGNPEVEAVLDRRLRRTSAAELLSDELIRGHTSLVVAGTHGKTTTTGLLAFLLDRAGLDPSFLIGGIPQDFPRSYRLGRGEHFVIEGDEYDCAFFDKRPKFVHYLPDIAILGNVEYDHADIYPDLAAVEAAFTQLLNLIPQSGLLIAGVESEGVRALVGRARCRVETFSAGAMDADWQASEISAETTHWSFQLKRQGRALGEFRLLQGGEHNVRNALAALAAAAAAGVEPEAAREALFAFRGIRRRLELRGQARGVAVYDDFAHHPTAVAATLAALRGAPHAGRIIALFEPRSYTCRTRIFQDAFAEAFQAADLVVVAAAHMPGKVPEDQRLSEGELVDSIAALGVRAAFIPSVDAIVESVASEAREGDRVVVLSNGGFGGIHEKLLAALQR